MTAQQARRRAAGSLTMSPKAPSANILRNSSTRPGMAQHAQHSTTQRNRQSHHEPKGALCHHSAEFQHQAAQEQPEGAGGGQVHEPLNCSARGAGQASRDARQDLAGSWIGTKKRQLMRAGLGTESSKSSVCIAGHDALSAGGF